MYNWLYNFISGILIGTCMILPGVSGSVIAIMLGIYEYVIFLISSSKSYYYKIIKFFPIAIGMIIGVFIFGKILLLFYNKYTFYMIYIFMGLMLGSIPILKREIKEKNGNINYKVLFTSLSVSLILLILTKKFNSDMQSNYNSFNLFIGGFLYISGKIIPGISSSFFLMILGLYNYLLEIITDPLNITMDVIISLLPFLFGAFIGCIVFIKLINYLLNNYFSETYSGIIGFIIGSVIIIYPGIKFNINFIFALILMAFSYKIVNKLSKKSQKK